MSFEVSVIIPVYNARRFLQKSIQSALDQEEVKEVLVIDDGSNDGSYEYLQSWNEQEERMRLFTHANRENLGPGPSRNVGIEHASCEYVAFLDADDYYLEERFKSAKQHFNQNIKIAAYYEPVVLEFDIPYKVNIGQEDLVKYDGNYYLAFHTIPKDVPLIETWLLDGSVYTIIGATYKKQVLIEINGFDEQLYQSEDTDLHFRIALNYKVYCEQSLLLCTTVKRVHSSNMSYYGNKRFLYRGKLYSKYIYLLKHNYSKAYKFALIEAYLYSKVTDITLPKLKRMLIYMYYSTYILKSFPQLAIEYLIYKLKTL